MARQLNYARRAIVPVRQEKNEVLPFQYHQPVTTSRLVYFLDQSKKHENTIKLKSGKKDQKDEKILERPRYQPMQEINLINEYRENSHLFRSNIVSSNIYRFQTLLNKQPPSSGKLKDSVKRNNIDYFYKFVDIIEADFQKLLEDSVLTHRSLKYLQTDVQTIFTVENYKVLRKLGILPNDDVLVGRKEFADAVEKSLYTLKLMHTDCELFVQRVMPRPEKLQVEVRYTFKGMTRLPKKEVIIDFIVKFNFSKASKQVHLIEFTDKHVKSDMSNILKGLGALALPLIGFPCPSDNVFGVSTLLNGNLIDKSLIEQFADLETDELLKNGDLVTLEHLVNPIYVHSD